MMMGDQRPHLITYHNHSNDDKTYMALEYIEIVIPTIMT